MSLERGQKSKVEEQGGKPARQGVCKDLVGAPFAGGSSYQREMNFLGSSAPALISFFFFFFYVKVKDFLINGTG